MRLCPGAGNRQFYHVKGRIYMASDCLIVRAVGQFREDADSKALLSAVEKTKLDMSTLRRNFIKSLSNQPPDAVRRSREEVGRVLSLYSSYADLLEDISIAAGSVDGEIKVPDDAEDRLDQIISNLNIALVTARESILSNWGPSECSFLNVAYALARKAHAFRPSRLVSLV